MSQCYADRQACLRRLERRLDAHPRVEWVGRLSPEESPRNHDEVEAVVETTRYGTAPLAVARAICECELEIAVAGPHQNPDFRQFVVR